MIALKGRCVSLVLITSHNSIKQNHCHQTVETLPVPPTTTTNSHILVGKDFLKHRTRLFKVSSHLQSQPLFSYSSYLHITHQNIANSVNDKRLVPDHIERLDKTLIVQVTEIIIPHSSNTFNTRWTEKGWSWAE